MVGAGFTRGRRDEAHVAHACAGSIALQHRFHHAGGEKSYARVEDLAGGWRVVRHDVAGGGANAGQQPGIQMHASVCKDGISTGHVERRGVIGADGHGGGSARALDASVARQGSHAIEAHQ